MKKHVSQMTDKEKRYLIHRFKSIPQSKWTFTKYSKKRLISRNVDMSTFRSLWSDGFDLIEYHKHDFSGHNRVLLRSKCTDNYDNQVCAVFNFSTNQITTVYLNWRKNKHSSLVISEYDSSINVKEMMRRAN